MKKKEIISNIFPEYQAIIDVNNSDIESTKKYHIVKYEALLRSKVKDEILYPDTLLSDKININNREFTKKMFIKILKDIEKYKINVSFNINLSDIEDKNILELFYKHINRNLDGNKIGKYLTFEFIEEEEIIKNKTLVTSFIEELHKAGSKVALDDFGKGYATFEPMLEFDFDIIKFDKILVSDFLKQPKKYYLLNTLIEMFNKLNKKVVAEYIENKNEFNAIKYINCNYAQGYCIAKPQKIENYLKNSINRNL